VIVRSELGTSPDFKIKKMVGAESFRDQALQNSRCSPVNRCDSELGSLESGEQETSVARLMETSKMRRLQQAKSAWLSTHNTNSPFRFRIDSLYENFESVSSFESQEQPHLLNQKLNLNFAESPGLGKTGSKTSTFAKNKGGVSNELGSIPSFKPALKKVKNDANKGNSIFSPTFSKSKKLLEPLQTTNKAGTPKALSSLQILQIQPELCD
jgi:hypothetical protein